MTRASPFRPSVLLSDERDPLTRVETSCQRETCTGHFTARSKDEPSPPLGGGGAIVLPESPVNCLPLIPRDSRPPFRLDFVDLFGILVVVGHERTRGEEKEGGRPSL